MGNDIFRNEISVIDLSELLQQMLEVLVGMGDLQLDGIGSGITIKFSIDGFIRSRIAFLIATITILDAQHPHSQHVTFAFGHT